MKTGESVINYDPFRVLPSSRASGSPVMLQQGSHFGKAQQMSESGRSNSRLT